MIKAGVTIEALEAGKHVLVEKPMALNGQEGEKMVKVAREKKRILMVGMNYRYFPEIQVLKRFIEQGELGDIYQTSIFPQPFWDKGGSDDQSP